MAVAVSAVLLLAGCGSAVQDAPAPGGGTAEGFPVTDDNCGVTTTYTAPPARAVTLTSNATELMLELGLQDAMVGTSYLKNRPIGEKYAEAYAGVPVLAPGQPSLEQLVAAEPDFVYSGYPDGFSESNGHTRPRLAELGIDTHLNPESCREGRSGFEDLFGEMDRIGAIFGVPDRAAASVGDLRGRLDRVRAQLGDVEPVPVFVYNSGADAPRTAGGKAILTEMIERAGGRNVFDDVAERWPQVSWEQVAQRRPAVILIYDYLEPSVESKIATLRSTLAIAAVPALATGAFPTVALSEAQPGPRSVDAVEQLARDLHPDRFR
ncbi:ABC transporter (iron.B12.siderophore.hemin), periplasmic substrate-binding component [Pseudonocardia sp. Ae168_Ps1]|nr:ABC transporter (iron.B12.siderophore.hemin), periplasmic substrate-binding component [Pseudonocardia sp. Ae150A_Ps1]OLL80435.1 ABC transporter (iron.B12.siderophore.hemin), periplasmic substrate-binding component [Pseudonocardia sp. Ae168_Ps1]OLL85438.1 ABC transporter (iron.B12.siderophore.hemin), periplasmic substrate-binding component [Pseudonocardia sp. Ae263_Ps1]OLL94535.1 ABC transporter (iron.B12.siderophore.hemin), periplasmic substrate-binding component [Pseudonocardia sp. Ae356_Ps1